MLIGVLGSKPAPIKIKPLPPLEAVAAIVEPLPAPPPVVSESREQEQNEQEKPDAAQVVIVTPESPSINFAVPTIGNLLVAAPLAKAPPLRPMQAPVALKQQPLTLNTTGVGGERPQPPYPKIALEQREQGTVVLLLNVDATGAITSVEVKTSSGFPILDRGALEFVKRHWTVPSGAGTRVFEATINYQLQKG
jgi:protein TonB